MSLVDYASSDEDAAEEELREKQGSDSVEEPAALKMAPLPPPPSRSCPPHNQTSVLPQSNADSFVPSIELPDASVLLSSPALPSNFFTSSDHSTRVAAAMAENASRKRDSYGLPSSLPRNKVPRGTLHHQKNIPDIVGGALLPPQLRGRSNVVTEDMGKLFVKKHSDSSTQ